MIKLEKQAGIQLAALLGSSRAKYIEPNIHSLVDQEKIFTSYEPNERAAHRKRVIISLCEKLSACGEQAKLRAVYSGISCFRTTINDFTIPEIATNKLYQVMESGALSGWAEDLADMGNSLISYSYGFDEPQNSFNVFEQKEKFNALFGTQPEEFINSILSRGIGCGLLSLLPEEKQSPGGDDFKFVMTEVDPLFQTLA